MATRSEQIEVADQRTTESNANRDFRRKLRQGIQGDVAFALKQSAGVLSTETQQKIAEAVVAKVCQRISELFDIEDEMP